MAFYSTNYTDDFIADGDNDTFGWWSDASAITRFGGIE